MNKILLFLLTLLLATCSLFGQTTLFSETFEGAGHGLTLNSSDVGSTAGTSGSNYWVVNNAYNGGNGTLMCMGFPFSFTVNNTASQPAGITGAPNSKYLHVLSNAAASNGIQAASFIAADGFCNFDEYNFAKLSNSINTLGRDSVELSFYWMCTGGPQSYGELYYSTNNGTTWTLITTPRAQWNNQSSWVQANVSLPAFANQTNLKFAFRFVNLSTSNAADPPFCIDQIEVKGYNLNTLVVSSISSNSFCPGDGFNIDYTATGNYNAGNVFTAQLSDASGSFTSPYTIGSLASTSSGTIAATIPMAAAPGTAYQVRVVSSTPSIISSPHASMISVAEGPVAGIATANMDTVCVGSSFTVSLSGQLGSAVWEESSDGITFTASAFTGNSFSTNINANTWYRAIVQNSCGADTSNIVSLTTMPTPTPSFSATQMSNFNVNFSNLSSGASSYTWQFGDGNSSINLNPTHSYAAAGNYSVTLTATSSFGCENTVVINVSVIALAIQNNQVSLGTLELFPNPNSGSFALNIDLKESQDINIKLIDLNGRQAATLYQGFLPAGKQTIAVEQLELAQGFYLLELRSEKARLIQKLSIVR